MARCRDANVLDVLHKIWFYAMMHIQMHFHNQ